MKATEMAEAIRVLQEASTAQLAMIANLEERMAAVEAAAGPKQRGPKVERAMTDSDAYRVKFGDLQKESHKAAAAVLELSYGQVFSCRGGYTFKHVKNGTRNADGSEIVKEAAK